VTFQEKTVLSAGTVWGIVLGGSGYSSTSSTLVVSGLLPGSYALTVSPSLSPGGTIRYTTLGNPATIKVETHNSTALISYSTSYWVSVTGTPGGTTTPGSSWVVSGGSIFINVSVFQGYRFLGWNGTGAGAYSGTSEGTSLTVTSPIEEVATFAPLPTTVTTTNGASSLWAQPTTWIGLAVVGLLVGLVVGLVVSRRSGRQPPSPTPYEAPPAMDGGGDAGGSIPPYGGSQ
jgi:hypothetical protein